MCFKRSMDSILKVSHPTTRVLGLMMTKIYKSKWISSYVFLTCLSKLCMLNEKSGTQNIRKRVKDVRLFTGTQQWADYTAGASSQEGINQGRGFTWSSCWGRWNHPPFTQAGSGLGTGWKISAWRRCLGVEAERRQGLNRFVAPEDWIRLECWSVSKIQ